MIDFGKMTRDFLLGESKVRPSLGSYLQSLKENLLYLKPRTIREKNIIEMSKHQLVEIRKLTRKLEEHVNILEEQVKILEEGNIETLKEVNEE